jgi:hypothetical protein
MVSNNQIDSRSQHFGLPASPLIPIAAKDTSAIENYVGSIQERVSSSSGQVNAMSVIPFASHENLDPMVSLWNQPDAERFKNRLHPAKQVWVHVDYNGHRVAYERFGMPEIHQCHVLDHIQNREAIHLRDYSHPYFRLSRSRGR